MTSPLKQYFKAAVPTFLAPGNSFMEDNFSTDSGRGQQVRVQETGGGAQAVIPAKLRFLACCMARYLTDHRPVLVRGQGIRDP